MLKKLFFTVALLSSLAAAACDYLTIPTDYLTVDKWRRAGEAANWTATKGAHDDCADSLNLGPLARIGNWTTSLQIKSLQDMSLKLDDDNNGTHRFAILNGGGDSLFRVQEDSAAKFFGALAVAGRTTLSDSLIAISARWTGNISATNGTYFGTLGVTGTTTLGGKLIFGAGSFSASMAQAYTDATSGLVLTGKAGSSYDLVIANADGNSVMRVPTGTTTAVLPGDATVGSTLGVTGASTLNGGLTAQAASGNHRVQFLAAAAGAVSDINLGRASSGNERVTIGYDATGGAAYMNTSGGIAALNLQESGGATTAGGTFRVSGVSTVGTGSGNALQLINGGAGQNREIAFQSGGSYRWYINVSSSTESGSDAGSNFNILARTDAGAAIDAPISIVRAAGGVITLARPLTVNNLAGTGTRLTTSTSTGVVGNATTIAGANTWSDAQTFTAAPRFNSATASEFLLLDGSKDLTSVAGNGTGNVVRTTSPALVTPALGAATATSLVASGNVTGDSLRTTGGEAFTHGDTSFTITVSAGMTTTPTGTAYGTKIGKVVTLFIPNISGTSNSAQFTLSGIPPTWTPATIQHVPYMGGTDDGVPQFAGIAYVMTDNTILLGTAAGGFLGWTTSGTKATGFSSIGTTLTYLVL